MSTYAMVAVWRYSMLSGMDKLVLLAIADQVDWPEAQREISEDLLADMVGRQPRQIRTYLQRIAEKGELHIIKQPGKKSIYHIPPFPGEPDRYEEQRRLRQRRQQQTQERRQQRGKPTRPAPAPAAPVGTPQPAQAAQAAQPAQEVARPAPAPQERPAPSQRAEQTWYTARMHLRAMIPGQQYDSWIAPLRLVALTRANHQASITLRAPSSSDATIVGDRYTTILRTALAQALSMVTSAVVIELEPQPAQERAQ